MMTYPANSTSVSPTFPCLSSSDVHVWFCDLLPYVDAQETLAAILSLEEQARAARFAFDRDRQRFILSHALLRLILSRYIRIDAGQVQFSSGQHGKPSISGAGAAAEGLQFSLSHSGSYALVAVARGRAVGVDLEMRKPGLDVLKLAQRFFAPSESRLIATADGEIRQHLFYRFWTAKEAYVKGRGVGLSLGLDRFEVSFEGESSLGRVRWTESGVFDSAWQIRSLLLRNQLAGAIAAEGDAWELHSYESTGYSFS